MMRLTAFLLAATACAAAPAVVKVEPPNWWPGHSMNPVRVLIRGTNLGGATVVQSKLKTSNVRVNERGTYLFADVTIPKGTPAGDYPLQIRAGGASVTAPFRVDAPLPAEGRFQGFSPSDVIYLIMPDRFSNGDPGNDDPTQSPGLLDRGKPRYYHGGDLEGIRARLPYLKSLGVTAIWTTPVYDNVNHLNRKETYDGQPITDYHGYGAVDFYALDEHLGSLATYRKLVDAAHAAGIKVIQDQVANHTGPYHPWVEDSPTPTWYNGTAAKHLANTWQTWTLMDPHAPAALRKSTLDGWFIDILPDLNQDDPETARYLIQNTLWWIGVSGLDGVRQDTLSYVPRSFWRDWMHAIKRQYPKLQVVGELFDGDPALVSFFQGGRKRFDGIDSGIDALFDFPLLYPLRAAFIEGKPLTDLAKMFARDHLYPDPSRLVTFLGLHDMGRFLGERGATPEGLKLAFTLLMTTRGTPMIYYGDEIGMTGGGDPDNRRDFPGGWSADRQNAFEESGRTPSQAAVWEHVRRLTSIRSNHPSLHAGPMTTLAATARTFAFARKAGTDQTLVVFNLENAETRLRDELAAAGFPAGAPLRDLLGGGKAQWSGGSLEVAVPARSAAIFSRTP